MAKLCLKASILVDFEVISRVRLLPFLRNTALRHDRGYNFKRISLSLHFAQDHPAEMGERKSYRTVARLAARLFISVFADPHTSAFPS